MNHKTQNGVVKAQKAAIKVANYQGRDDRATSEQVMDPRTRLILFKLLSRGVFEWGERVGGGEAATIRTAAATASTRAHTPSADSDTASDTEALAEMTPFVAHAAAALVFSERLATAGPQILHHPAADRKLAANARGPHQLRALLRTPSKRWQHLVMWKLFWNHILTL